MSTASLEYIAAGGNRNPSAADWDLSILAYGTGNNIALWNPESSDKRGVSTLLSGHTDVVNSVKLFKDQTTNKPFLVSGSADKTVRVWVGNYASPVGYIEAKCLSEHTGSVNAIAVLPESNLFITGAADATVKVWRFQTSSTEVSKRPVDFNIVKTDM